MRKKKQRRSRPAERMTEPTRIDKLQIASGRLGPIGPCELAIRPMTVLIGKQGTGKSLIAQVLYALEELPFLAQYVTAQKKRGEHLDAETIFTRVLDRLRSAERRFARFATGETKIVWRHGAPWESPINDRSFEFTITADTRRIHLNTECRDAVTLFTDGGLAPIRSSVFVPTERMVVSQLRNALAERLLALPITYELFADWLENAHDVQKEVSGRESEIIDDLSRSALNGSVTRLGEQWKWRFAAAGSKKTEVIALDLASSGQRANWSIGYLARALYGLRERGDYKTRLTMFVEEPELHLHPSAQVAMVQILAILVNSGFRVVFTTYSLTCIYTINNLLLAEKRLGNTQHTGAPDPLLRLDVNDVAVYSIRDGTPTDIVNRKESFIDEHELGDVGAELGAEMNFLLNLEA